LVSLPGRETGRLFTIEQTASERWGRVIAMDTNTLIIILLVVLLLGGGGFFYRGRR
jgi:LPXTG-motif cell wall-anchored protein